MSRKKPKPIKPTKRTKRTKPELPMPIPEPEPPMPEPPLPEPPPLPPLPESFEGRLFQSEGRMIGEYEDVIAFPYRSYQDYKDYLHVIRNGEARDYLLTNSEGINSAFVSTMMTARDEIWIAFNIPITINQYHIGSDAVTLVSSTTLGDSKSHLKDLIKLDSGKLFVAWHQFVIGKVDEEGNPGIDIGFAYRTLDGNWHTLPYTWVFPFGIPATQGAVCQHPADGSIWFFCQPDSRGLTCVIHLVEIGGEISIDWTDYNFLNKDDGAMAPEGELPFFSAVADKERNAIILAYQSRDRKQFSVDPFCKGAKPAVIQVNSDATKSLLFVLDKWVERTNSLYIGLNSQNEVWLACGKIDEVNLTWNDLYISTENKDQYCGKMQYGIPKNAGVRLCNSSRLAVATMDDGFIHFFEEYPIAGKESLMAFTPRTETYVDVGSLTDPFDITVTKPTDTANGDILFCCINWYSSGTIDSVPSGWTLLGEYLDNFDKHALYYKIAASEPGSWDWSFTATGRVRAVCSCYTGGDFNAADPIDVVSNTAYQTSNTICRAASMTVAAANSPLVFWGCVYSVDSRTFTKPSVPTTDWIEDDDAGSTTSRFWTEICSFIWSGSGATGDMDATINAVTTMKHAFAVALKPAGGVTHYGAATLSGIGTLAGIGRGVFIGKSTLAGSGLLSAIGVRIYAGKATLSGVGSVVASAVTTLIGKATLAGAGTLAGIGHITAIGKATLSGVGTLAAIAGVFKLGAATLTGVGTLVASGVITAIGKATLSGTGTLSAIGRGIFVGAATLAGTGTLRVIGNLGRILRVVVVTTHYRAVNAITTTHRQVNSITTYYRKVKVATTHNRLVNAITTLYRKVKAVTTGG